MKLTFKYERETKRTIRYQEHSDNPAVGVLYIQKFAIKDDEGGYPVTLNVTIEPTTTVAK